MTALQSIYDFETPVEVAFAIAFGASEISVYTPSNDGLVTAAWVLANPQLATRVLSAITFQKERPRIELLARIGAARGLNYPASGVQPIGGYAHEMARHLGITIKVITNLEILQHRQFVAQVRGQMATILVQINGDETQDNTITGQQLTIHRIPILDEAGATNAYTTEDGNFVTDLNYAGQITVQESAITDL
jgi:hypothetical protein